jgi:hypothetical protein
MSKIRLRVDVNHLPSFTERQISGNELLRQYNNVGIEKPFPISDSIYYYVNDVDLAQLIPYMVIKSNLYREDRFDCEDYALKAQVTCAELFGLNSMRYTYGKTPLGYHGFNTAWVGHRFLVFEPNEAFWAYLDGHLLFELGENDYEPLKVLL